MVITSAITPEPGSGSSPTFLSKSSVLAWLLLYMRHHAASDRLTWIRAYDLNPVRFNVSYVLLARRLVVPLTVVLLERVPPPPLPPPVALSTPLAVIARPDPTITPPNCEVVAATTLATPEV